jgi:hypothetical protein
MPLGEALNGEGVYVFSHVIDARQRFEHDR